MTETTSWPASRRRCSRRRNSLPRDRNEARLGPARHRQSGESRYGRRANPRGRKAMKLVGPLLLAVFLIGGASLAVAQELRPVEHPEQLGFSATRLQRLT